MSSLRDVPPSGIGHRDDTVVVDVLVELRWAETGELAESRDGAVAFVAREGRISSLTVHPDLTTALSATGLDEADRQPDP